MTRLAVAHHLREDLDAEIVTMNIILQDMSQTLISRSIARCARRSARPSSITVLSQPIAWLFSESKKHQFSFALALGVA
jgi:preprotein translocase subunit SecF